MMKILLIIYYAHGNLISFLTKMFLRLNGAKIGKNVFVSYKSRIVCKDLIIGNDSIIKSGTIIKANKFKLGNSCIISENCYITGNSNLTIGDMTFVGKKVRMNISENITIGSDVGIGENSVIWTHGYFPPADEKYPITYRPVSIDDGTWVSTNIIILPGVSLGKRVIVGAGTVITKSFEDNSLIAGNPAKYLKSTEDIKVKDSLMSIMREILSKHFNFIDESEKCLVYEWKTNYVLFIDGEINDISKKYLIKNSLVLFKNMKQNDTNSLKKYIWFDMSTREVIYSKNKNVKLLLDILRGWGIRFTVNYNA